MIIWRHLYGEWIDRTELEAKILDDNYRRRQGEISFAASQPQSSSDGVGWVLGDGDFSRPPWKFVPCEVQQLGGRELRIVVDWETVSDPDREEILDRISLALIYDRELFLMET